MELCFPMRCRRRWWLLRVREKTLQVWGQNGKLVTLLTLAACLPRLHPLLDFTCSHAKGCAVWRLLSTTSDVSTLRHNPHPQPPPPPTHTLLKHSILSQPQPHRPQHSPRRRWPPDAVGHPPCWRLQSTTNRSKPPAPIPFHDSILGQTRDWTRSLGARFNCAKRPWQTLGDMTMVFAHLMPFFWIEERIALRRGVIPAWIQSTRAAACSAD